MECHAWNIYAKNSTDAYRGFRVHENDANNVHNLWNVKRKKNCPGKTFRPMFFTFCVNSNYLFYFLSLFIFRNTFLRLSFVRCCANETKTKQNIFCLILMHFQTVVIE